VATGWGIQRRTSPFNNVRRSSATQTRRTSCYLHKHVLYALDTVDTIITFYQGSSGRSYVHRGVGYNPGATVQTTCTLVSPQRARNFILKCPQSITFTTIHLWIALGRPLEVDCEKQKRGGLAEPSAHLSCHQTASEDSQASLSSKRQLRGSNCPTNEGKARNPQATAAGGNSVWRVFIPLYTPLPDAYSRLQSLIYNT